MDVGQRSQLLKQMLIDAILTLPEDLVLPFVLRFEYGWDHERIATGMRKTTREVEVAQNRALDLLRPALEPFARDG